MTPIIKLILLGLFSFTFQCFASDSQENQDDKEKYCKNIYNKDDLIEKCMFMFSLEEIEEMVDVFDDFVDQAWNQIDGK